MEYHKESHYVYSCQYQIVFCPKYRKKILVDEIERDLKNIIEEVCHKKQVNIIEMEIMPDHVHLLLDCPMHLSPIEIVKHIKQQSAVRLKRDHPWLRSRLPNLWTRSAFISTVGSTSLEVVKHYIENQKLR